MGVGVCGCVLFVTCICVLLLVYATSSMRGWQLVTLSITQTREKARGNKRTPATTTEGTICLLHTVEHTHACIGLTISLPKTSRTFGLAIVPHHNFILVLWYVPRCFRYSFWFLDCVTGALSKKPKHSTRLMKFLLQVSLRYIKRLCVYVHARI